MNDQQRQDWIAEQTRHIDEINSLLSRLEGIIDAACPNLDDSSHLDRDEEVITSALQHYRDYWQAKADEIAAM